MLHDIAPHKLFNRFYNKSIKPESRLLYIKNGCLLVKKTEPDENGSVYELLSASDFKEINDDCTYLFSLDKDEFFLLRNDDKFFLKDIKTETLSIRDIQRKSLFPKHMIFAVMTASHLAAWYDENIYCGSCGHKTFPDTQERALLCPRCHRHIYPKIMPAVIVAITNGDEIVLTKYRGRDVPYYALVAGFTEIGEAFEDTVRREAMEEVGLKVKNIRYYKSQPWAIACDILAGYYCDVDGDTDINMDPDELKEAVWVKRSDIISQPTNFSLTNEMMLLFRDGKEPV